jgi:hypothetical protein
VVLLEFRATVKENVSVNPTLMEFNVNVAEKVFTTSQFVRNATAIPQESLRVSRAVVQYQRVNFVSVNNA